MAPAALSKPAPGVPHRQIRALYDDNTITVYQAYSAAIAEAAVAAQQLDASPLFRKTRMTWIKPSWAWMLYRAGYSYKDAGQERILAIRLSRACFLGLLETAVLTHAGRTEEIVDMDGGGSGDRAAKRADEQPGRSNDRKPVVKVQWDPERTVRLEKLPYRSIQVGIPGALADKWIPGIVGIEDVTERARELKKTLDKNSGVALDELVDRGLAPAERPFEVSQELQRLLGMNV